MHLVQAKGILSAHNGMNLYRGCLHGCIYCDSRSVCYGMKHDFEDIEVKINAPELLEKALRSKRKKCMIGTGSMTDPYIPLEKEFKLTRSCLELIDQYGFGVSLLTKSNLIMRDMDLIEHINQNSKAVVQMTLTTYNEDLCRIVEPNVATTQERFEVLMECKRRNIPTIVWMGPILPYINDNLDNLKGLLDLCIQANVKGILLYGFGLTLREGNREYYYQKLDEHFPGLKEVYIREYGNAYEVGSKHSSQLWRYFQTTCKKHNIMINPDDLWKYLEEYPTKYEQISLF